MKPINHTKTTETNHSKSGATDADMEEYYKILEDNPIDPNEPLTEDEKDIAADHHMGMDPW